MTLSHDSLGCSDSGLQPGTLWSLLEMQRFRAASFVTATGALQRAHSGLVNVANFAGGRFHALEVEGLKAAFDEASPALAEMPLSLMLREQYQRTLRSVERGDSMESAVMLREFLNNLMVELSSPWFLMIPSADRALYEQRTPAFGEEVAKAFGEAMADIAGAGRCYALNEWTACVFHLMRVLEHGLRKLGCMVNLDSDAIALENWKNIIDQIEKKIREIEALPKSPEKSERLRVLSAAATQFRYFKDAWRNHVAHSRVVYDQHTAPPIWTHVKEFMQHLAKTEAL